MFEKLSMAPSPHIKDRATTASLMRTVILALLPAAGASVYIFGLRSLLLMAVCVLTSVAAEFLYQTSMKRPVTISDGSAALTGLLLAFNLPSGFPIWMAMFGSVTAIVVVKQLFGGVGQNFANPAIAARIILLISFASPMSTFLVPGVDMVVGATPLELSANGLVAELPTTMQLLLGQHGGSLGETCAVALLAGGVFLIVTKVIKPITPLAFLGTMAVFAVVTGQDPVFHLLTGGAILGAFFMATDYSTTPLTDTGKLIFGIGCGFITMLIRVYGTYPEGVSFAILLMNIITPHIDNLTKTKPLGGVDA